VQPASPPDPVQALQDYGKLKFVVLCTYRGGSTFTSHVLCRLGVVTGHELLVGRTSLLGDRLDDPVKYPHNFRWENLSHGTLEADVGGANWLQIPLFQATGIPLVHLIRHPIKTANSLLAYGFPSIRTKSQAIREWYRVHKASRTAGPVATIKLENVVEGLMDMADKLGLLWDRDRVQYWVDKTHHNPGLRSTFDVRWSHMPSEAQDLARAYGYEPL